VKKQYSSETFDSTHNLTLGTNGHSTNGTIGNWYLVKDPRSPDRELNASDGPYQQIGLECFVGRSRVREWLWQDTLLDTGTDTINLTNEITLRECGLYDRIVRYREPPCFQNQNVPVVTVANGYQIPIVGEIDIDVEWRTNNGITLNIGRHTIRFKVLQASTESGMRPTCAFIVGQEYMDDMRISILSRFQQ